jgi:hypothetical protein
MISMIDQFDLRKISEEVVKSLESKRQLKGGNGDIEILDFTHALWNVLR